MNSSTEDDQASLQFGQSVQVPSQSSPLTPSPSLALWSRKLAFQSEELAAIIQSSSCKLQEHHSSLETLLNSCKADITTTKAEIEAAAKAREEEINTQINTLRRASQRIPEVLFALDEKLSLLSALPQIHARLQSHEHLLREFAANQSHLLGSQEKLASIISVLSAAQENQINRVLRILARIERPSKTPSEIEESQATEDAVVKNSQPQQVLRKSKRQRRLLSDEEMMDELLKPIQRVVSAELLSVEDIRRTREADRGENIVTENRGGGVGIERPLKRKLLSTLDVEQFAYTDEISY